MGDLQTKGGHSEGYNSVGNALNRTPQLNTQLFIAEYQMIMYYLMILY